MDPKILEEAITYVNSEIDALENAVAVSYDSAKVLFEQLPERIRYFVKEHCPAGGKKIYLDMVGFTLTQRARAYSGEEFFKELSDKLWEINKEIRHWLD